MYIEQGILGSCRGVLICALRPQPRTGWSQCTCATGCGNGTAIRLGCWPADITHNVITLPSGVNTVVSIHSKMILLTDSGCMQSRRLFMMQISNQLHHDLILSMTLQNLPALSMCSNGECPSHRDTDAGCLQSSAEDRTGHLTVMFCQFGPAMILSTRQ